MPDSSMWTLTPGQPSAGIERLGADVFYQVIVMQTVVFILKVIYFVYRKERKEPIKLMSMEFAFLVLGTSAIATLVMSDKDVFLGDPLHVWREANNPNITTVAASHQAANGTKCYRFNNSELTEHCTWEIESWILPCETKNAHIANGTCYKDAKGKCETQAYCGGACIYIVTQDCQSIQPSIKKVDCISSALQDTRQRGTASEHLIYTLLADPTLRLRAIYLGNIWSVVYNVLKVIFPNRKTQQIAQCYSDGITFGTLSLVSQISIQDECVVYKSFLSIGAFLMAQSYLWMIVLFVGIAFAFLGPIGLGCTYLCGGGDFQAVVQMGEYMFLIWGSILAVPTFGFSIASQVYSLLSVFSSLKSIGCLAMLASIICSFLSGSSPVPALE